MKAIITEWFDWQAGVGHDQITVTVFYLDGSDVQAASSFDVSLSGVTDLAGLKAALQAGILNNANNVHSFGMTAADIIWAFPSVYDGVARAFANPTRSLNSAFQISTTRDADATYSVDIAIATTALAGQKGKVELKHADDSGFTTNVVTVATISNGAGALLNLSNNNTLDLHGIIPAGKYVKLVPTNVTGTPTFTFVGSQEVLL